MTNWRFRRCQHSESVRQKSTSPTQSKGGIAVVKGFIAFVKWTAEFVWELPITIAVLADWIKGYKYYDLDSAFFDVSLPQTLKAGAIIKVEHRKYPHDPKIRPIHKAVGDPFVILDINHIAHREKWALVRLGKCNTSTNIRSSERG